MSEHSIDPYAPPETDVENRDYSASGEVKAYKDSKLLIVHPDFIFPEICPKTGKESELVLSDTFVMRVMKWRDRPWWVNLLTSASAFFYLMCFLQIDNPRSFTGEAVFLSIISFFLMLIIFELVKKWRLKKYDLKCYYNKRYLGLFRKTHWLFRVAPILFVLSFILLYGYFVSREIESLAILFILLLLCMFTIYANMKYGYHFIVKKYKHGYLYLRGAHPKFLAKLPSVPLSGLKEE